MDGSDRAGRPSFPPLITGLASGPADPFAVALARARHGVDAGLLVWSLTPSRLRTALVLAPEEPLERAVAALPACLTGLRDALGVLAPPETAVHLSWRGALRVNGGEVGTSRITASMPSTGPVPRWMVVGWTLRLRMAEHREPGHTPASTALFEEGCGEVAPVALLEAYARHALHWLSQLDEPGGRVALGREWQGVLWDRGGEVEEERGGIPARGTFLGVDDNFGMLLKGRDRTRSIPLTTLVEAA
jgi:hypothetical protein